MMYDKFKYDFNGKEFVTIEAKNDDGERVWIKADPLDKQELALGAHILDRPQDVNWKIKKSHLEEFAFGKRNDVPAISSGSMYYSTGWHQILKDPSSTAVFFPLSPIENIRTFDNFNSGSNVSMYINKNTWIGYITTAGTIIPRL